MELTDPSKTICSGYTSQNIICTFIPTKLCDVPYCKTHRKIADKLKQECSICFNAIFVPYKLRCGHTFCRNCIMRWADVEEDKKCPVCRDNTSLMYTAYSKNRILTDLDVQISDCDFFIDHNCKSKDFLNLCFETCTSLLQNEWLQSEDSDYLDILYDLATHGYNIDKSRFKKIYSAVKTLLIKYS